MDGNRSGRWQRPVRRVTNAQIVDAQHHLETLERSIASNTEFVRSQADSLVNDFTTWQHRTLAPHHKLLFNPVIREAQHLQELFAREADGERIWQEPLPDDVGHTADFPAKPVLVALRHAIGDLLANESLTYAAGQEHNAEIRNRIVAFSGTLGSLQHEVEGLPKARRRANGLDLPHGFIPPAMPFRR